MSTYKSKFKQSQKERQYRKFSESFKRKKVKEIELGKSTVMEVGKAYEVTRVAVYIWINKYSMKSKPERRIVESKSDTQRYCNCKKKIADLERKLGQKQIELEFQGKMIELTEKKYRIDIKKK